MRVRLPLKGRDFTPAPADGGSAGRGRSSRPPRRCPARRCRSGGRGRRSCRSGRNARRRASACGGRATAPSQASVAGMAVEHRDEAAVRRHVREQPLDVAAGVDEAALARPLRRRPAGVEPVGRGDGEQADVAPVLGHQADRLDRLRRDRARIGDDDLRVRPGLAQPIGAVDDVLRRAPASSRAAAARSCGSRGADRPSRRSRRAASVRSSGAASVAVALQIVEGPAQDHRELVDEGRLEGGEPVLRHADQRRADRLVRAALRRERHARRRRRPG